jgi:hypothetical protein
VWSTGGVCLNFVDGLNATEERTRSAYLPADYERLVTLKKRFDAGNMFRFDHPLRSS